MSESPTGSPSSFAEAVPLKTKMTAAEVIAILVAFHEVSEAWVCGMLKGLEGFQGTVEFADIGDYRGTPCITVTGTDEKGNRAWNYYLRKADGMKLQTVG